MSTIPSNPQDPKRLPKADRVESRPVARRGSLGVAQCKFCLSTSLRLSTMRWPDIRRLFLFRIPLRCSRCGQRQYASFLIAAIATYRSPGPSVRSSRENETWKSWTELSSPDPTLARPMTTAANPRSRYIERTRADFPATGNKDDTIW